MADVLETIRRLVSLAGSESTPVEEARNAGRQACLLIMKHGISLSIPTAKAPSEAKPRATGPGVGGVDRAAKAWSSPKSDNIPDDWESFPRKSSWKFTRKISVNISLVVIEQPERCVGCGGKIRNGDEFFTTIQGYNGFGHACARGESCRTVLEKKVRKELGLDA